MTDAEGQPATSAGRELLDTLAQPWERGSRGYEGMVVGYRPAILAIEAEAQRTAPDRGCSECFDWMRNPLNEGRKPNHEDPTCPIRDAKCVRFDSDTEVGRVYQTGRLDGAEAQRTAPGLREAADALDTWGEHRALCDIRKGYRRCNCGLSKARAALSDPASTAPACSECGGHGWVLVTEANGETNHDVCTGCPDPASTAQAGLTVDGRDELLDYLSRISDLSKHEPAMSGVHPRTIGPVSAKRINDLARLAIAALAAQPGTRARLDFGVEVPGEAYPEDVGTRAEGGAG